MRESQGRTRRARRRAKRESLIKKASKQRARRRPTSTVMEQQRSEHPSLVKPLRCIVKLGGAAITCKNDLEKINETHLEMVATQLRQVMISGSSSSKVPGMDWSKRNGKLGISVNVDNYQELLESSSFIVVHGAGSFGHFQASQSGVHKGGLERPIVKAGFVATRISVSTLNLEVVRALAREGLPSLGLSPFSCGWSTRGKNIASANLSTVAKALDSGFIPVLHGDAVLDELQGCTILSGDVIIRHLAEHLKPDYVVFLTDVSGVYDRPPTEPDAVLLKEIAVREDGSWSVVKPPLEDNHVKMTAAAHDTTGGMETKISEAAIIAKLGIDVYIVQAATTHSIRALSGELKGNIPDDWLGTAIRFAG
ncbi:isopentenyl phosphate kinase isoform X2 [Eucalyptus grandis]|uniref:isopentenyl phosphate kinase isoform X2 n=1 Tax=Eucalyptus grandis TaxID=71139 RepID=UPI00192EE4F3|nr:isopentenyl phosphate kinase isoform X2 [Eucalyptus grandis]